MTNRKLRKLIINAVPIETDRIVLRHISQKDACDMFEYASLDEVCEFLLWSPHINLATTEGYIQFLEKRYLRGLYGDWAVALKDTGKMIGTCGYANIDLRNRSCEIGYVLSPFYRGRGYMSEAMNEILKFTFNVLQLESAWLRIIDENTASKRLAERFGFSFRYYTNMEIKEITRKIAHYSLNKDEYSDKK